MVKRIRRSYGRSLLVIGILFAVLPGAASAGEPEVMAALATLRYVQPVSDDEERERLNKRLDEAWRVLSEEGGGALPIVARELRTELSQTAPDQFFLLDTALFLVAGTNPEAEVPGSTDLALEALGRMDVRDPTVKVNILELARLAHAMARLKGASAWPQIDRIFLSSNYDLEFFQAPHYVKLSANSLRVILYGASGASVEDHLVDFLTKARNVQDRQTVLTLLTSLGSERSTNAVRELMNSCRDRGCFPMAVTVLMSVGGPTGRAAVLAARTDNLDAESLAYHQRILSAVRAVSYEKLRESVKAFDGDGPMLDDVELAKRLEAYAESGVDNELNPSNLLTSRIPNEKLLAKLKLIRSRSLWRLDQHGLDDIRVTNQIINALQYRPEP